MEAAAIPHQSYDDPGGTALAALLVELGRGAQAEMLLIESLRRAARGRDAGTPYLPQNGVLVELAGVYHQAGRHADVLALLDRAPNWMAKDLAELLSTPDSRGTPLGQMAAAALAAAGRKEAARAILEALLPILNGFDPAYALLVELRGQEAIPFLDAQFARDRFEERPLIWKATLQFRAGRLEEAEATARAAIAIDPSDGEQKHGRRMRVYAVLADIREARGDLAQADVLRGAIRAIRASEEADALYEAGLLDRAIGRYGEALTHFADAYCIQSRLAIQLARQGRLKEAEAHFRRAYELMPSSFGRMETHCFGCEGVFSGREAERIAETVFKQLIQESPEKPQPHYLLGYLRQQQGRYAEALVHFRAAVQRDPDYLNAWQHLQSLPGNTQADRDRATLNLLRLDPEGRHVRTDLVDVSDLRALWAAAEAASRLAPPPTPTTLYPLAASKETLDRLEMLTGDPSLPNPYHYRRPPGYPGYPGYAMGDWRTGAASLSPGQVIARQQVIAAAIAIIEGHLQQSD
jgi:tetratricopeptide (TPR) repeat protein